MPVAPMPTVEAVKAALSHLAPASAYSYATAVTAAAAEAGSMREAAIREVYLKRSAAVQARLRSGLRAYLESVGVEPWSWVGRKERHGRAKHPDIAAHLKSYMRALVADGLSPATAFDRYRVVQRLLYLVREEDLSDLDEAILRLPPSLLGVVPTALSTYAAWRLAHPNLAPLPTEAPMIIDIPVATVRLIEAMVSASWSLERVSRLRWADVVVDGTRVLVGRDGLPSDWIHGELRATAPALRGAYVLGLLEEHRDWACPASPFDHVFPAAPYSAEPIGEVRLKRLLREAKAHPAPVVHFDDEVAAPKGTARARTPRVSQESLEESPSRGSWTPPSGAALVTDDLRDALAAADEVLADAQARR